MFVTVMNYSYMMLSIRILDTIKISSFKANIGNEILSLVSEHSVFNYLYDNYYSTYYHISNEIIEQIFINLIELIVSALTKEDR